MTKDLHDVMDELDEGGDLIDSFLGGLARRVGLKAGARNVFGEPVERDGVTVIPVAKVRYGFGGGMGEGEDGDGMGQGGGGGVMASPTGFIEVRQGGATFTPIRDASAGWPMIVASGVAAWLVFRGLRALFR